VEQVADKKITPKKATKSSDKPATRVTKKTSLRRKRRK
jgi:hypothetical protein